MFLYKDEEADGLAGKTTVPRKSDDPERRETEEARSVTECGLDAVAGPTIPDTAKKTARDEGGGTAMIRRIAAFAMAGLLFSGLAASAQEYAWWPRPEPIEKASTVLAEVQSRPDYGSFGKVFYDRMNREYKITYVTKDGTPKQVRIDAVTGKQRGRAWQQ